MKINASPETIRAVGAALAKARLIDDRIGPADKGRIIAWSELVEPHGLGEDDLLQGVADFYSFPRDGRALQAADLITCSRSVRAARNMAESDAERRRREDYIDTRVAEQVAEIADSKALPGIYQRPQANSNLLVRCPWCRAGIGRHCTVPLTTDRPAGGTHPSRVDAAGRLGEAS